MSQYVCRITTLFRHNIAENKYNEKIKKDQTKINLAKAKSMVIVLTD